MERVAAWPLVGLTVTFAATIAFLARGYPYAPVLALTWVAVYSAAAWRPERVSAAALAAVTPAYLSFSSLTAVPDAPEMGVPAPAVLWLLAPVSGGCFGLLPKLGVRDRPQLVVFAYHGGLPIPRGDTAAARAWDGRATGRGADVERQGGDQDRAHRERVDEHAERDQQAELDVEDHRGDGQHHERPGEHDARTPA
ncbi:hypothetical protein SAMN05421833_13444 [Microbispora rosea]|uniref:Uncharacterized protein n=1 Tax=Microbispora rosea TaxID=58117 RepID=A0A1N7GYQ2_9ACTN|nr:hypothetical protein [Microbispora rosea]GIH47854.1 hypothetical protein Mro03_30330 [Microbispora rosea subsp. rosea]SIS17714.1 hypothetical protein SAMN05421833_13444 [Microbispora rosea]